MKAITEKYNYLTEYIATNTIRFSIIKIIAIMKIDIILIKYYSWCNSHIYGVGEIQPYREIFSSDLLYLIWMSSHIFEMKVQ